MINDTEYDLGSNNIAVASVFYGHIKELRVWDINSDNDYLHFYNRRIENAHTIKSLLCYLKCVGYSLDEIFYDYTYQVEKLFRTSLTSVTFSTITTNDC